jgi:hypothetical protein
MVLVWTPSGGWDLAYAVGDGSPTIRRAPPGGRPVTIAVPLPVAAGTVRYGSVDPRRPEPRGWVSRTYKCSPGGHFQIELGAGRDAVWQAGCQILGEPAALTAPAVATASGRWLNPSGDLKLLVATDRQRGVLIDGGGRGPSNELMHSGKGILWVDAEDPKGEVWALHAYGYDCADGGHLDVDVTASLVDDRPQVNVKLGGRGCRSTGVARRPCLSKQREPGKRRGVFGCMPQLLQPGCCFNGPKNPGEE